MENKLQDRLQDTIGRVIDDIKCIGIDSQGRSNLR